MNASYNLTATRLSSAADSARVAYWMEPGQRDYHIQSARKELLTAISGADAGMPYADSRALLLDQIEQAIADSMDVDWTPAHAAEAVLSSLFDYCLPKTPKIAEEVA